MASSFPEPPPRFEHQATAVQQELFLFGGRTEKEESSSCVHIFDRITESWNTRKTIGESIPRLFRGACTSDDHSVYVYGGEGNDGSPIDAFYKLDTNTLQWSKHDSVLNGLELERWYHSATAISLSPGMIEVTLFGGNSKYATYLAATVVVQFEYQVDSGGNGRWAISNTADTKALGTEKRVNTKIELIFVSRESVSMKFSEDQLSNEDNMEKENSASIKTYHDSSQVAAEDSGPYTACSDRNQAGVEETATLDTGKLYSYPSSDQSLEHREVKVDKGSQDFGFKFGESSHGLIVKKILDASQCPGICEGDIVWKVNQKNVLDFSAQQLTFLLEREKSVLFKVVRPSKDTTSLEKAIRQGNMEDVMFYLKTTDIDVNDCSFQSSNMKLAALMIASEEGKLQVVKLLIETHRAKINLTNREGWSALLKASLKGHVEVAKFLLEKGAEVDLQNREGWSALMLACKSGSLEVAQVLLEKGATVDLLLMVSCKEGHHSLVRLLLEKGVKFNLQNKTKGVALKIASQHGSLEVVKELLRSGADINMQDKRGWSALMSACKENHSEVVERLLQNKANVDLQNEKGYTALRVVGHSTHTFFGLVARE